MKGWSLLLNFAIILFRLQFGDDDGETPRACVGTDSAMAQSCLVQAFFDPLGKRIHEVAQRFRRQFLGADLNQEIPRPAHVSPAFCFTDSSIGKPSASRLS